MYIDGIQAKINGYESLIIFDAYDIHYIYINFIYIIDIFVLFNNKKQKQKKLKYTYISKSI